MLDEKLVELTELVATHEATILRLTEEAEALQIDYAQKLATAKVEHETAALGLKKQIRDLTLALELRNSNEHSKTKDGKKPLSVNAIWDEVLGE